MQGGPLVRFEGVSKRYGGDEAIREISFELARGELAFLTGHSGAGKSTVLRLLALLERPTRGRLIVDGEALERLPARAVPLYRRKVGLIFQDHKLLPDRNVYENIALPLRIAGLPEADIGRRIRPALDQVGLLHKERALPETLSGGEQQRVGIARAIVSRPPLLLADEPTGNLDPALSAEIMRLFKRLREAGSTVLIASHDLSLIQHMGERMLVLNHGRLQA